MKKRRKKQRYEFVDDGRVIANMNVDGMPRSLSDVLHLMNLERLK